MDVNEIRKMMIEAISSLKEEVDQWYDDNIPQGLQEENPNQFNAMTLEMNRCKEAIDEAVLLIETNI
jgi:site-specific DNA-adenine methylase